MLHSEVKKLHFYLKLVKNVNQFYIFKQHMFVCACVIVMCVVGISIVIYKCIYINKCINR